jgi:hypothetical protein
MDTILSKGHGYVQGSNIIFKIMNLTVVRQSETLFEGFIKYFLQVQQITHIRSSDMLCRFYFNAVK